MKENVSPSVTLGIVAVAIALIGALAWYFLGRANAPDVSSPRMGSPVTLPNGQTVTNAPPQLRARLAHQRAAQPAAPTP